MNALLPLPVFRGRAGVGAIRLQSQIKNRKSKIQIAPTPYPPPEYRQREQCTRSLPVPRQDLQHFDGLVGDALTGADFGVGVEAGPGLVTAEVVGFAVGQVADPVVG